MSQSSLPFALHYILLDRARWLLSRKVSHTLFKEKLENVRAPHSPIPLGIISSTGDYPRIAVVVTDAITRPQIARAVKQGADLFELRLDLCSSREPSHVRRVLERFAPYPVLATLRSAREGGKWEGPERERIALYEAILDCIAAVDVELQFTESVRVLRALTRDHGRVLIASYHNFHTTPPLRTLELKLAKAQALEADIAKIACLCKNIDDYRRLARLLVNQTARLPLIVIGMGEHSALSRVFFPSLGSVITYSFLGAPTAPGQLTLSQTSRLIRELYGPQA